MKMLAEVNTPALSRINWAQVVGAVAMLGAVFGLDISPEEQVKIVAAIGIGVQVVTMILRTFFHAKPVE